MTSQAEAASRRKSPVLPRTIAPQSTAKAFWRSGAKPGEGPFRSTCGMPGCVPGEEEAARQAERLEEGVGRHDPSQAALQAQPRAPGGQGKGGVGFRSAATAATDRHA